VKNSIPDSHTPHTLREISNRKTNRHSRQFAFVIYLHPSENGKSELTKKKKCVLIIFTNLYLL